MDARFTRLIEEVSTCDILAELILTPPLAGKSDPFAVFTLNGQKVFKSQTKKKTLSPEWNENFTVQVVSSHVRRELCKGSCCVILSAFSGRR